MKVSRFMFSVLALSLGVSGCASLSEGDCQAGAWGDYGYEDGSAGRASDLAKYAETCSSFGVVSDETAYLVGYKKGAEQYCSYRRGYNLGRNGNTYNHVCSGALASPFGEGYAAGKRVYADVHQRQSLTVRTVEPGSNAPEYSAVRSGPY